MCNRWLLAYTLLRNPSLASCRRTKKKTKPSDVSVNATPAILMSEEEGSTNNDEDQEGQSNVNVDEDHLILVDFNEGANCQSIERSECAKPDATNETSVNSQSPVLPMAESVCVVEPKEPQAVFPCEPLKECVTVDESCRTEVRQ